MLKVGDVDSKKLAEARLEVDVVDAKGSYVVPGFIDPHEHLLGGSGKKSDEIFGAESATK